jgi:hypothetical protein
VAIGRPIVVGASRKRFLGTLLSFLSSPLGFLGASLNLRSTSLGFLGIPFGLLSSTLGLLSALLCFLGAPFGFPGALFSLLGALLSLLSTPLGFKPLPCQRSDKAAGSIASRLLDLLRSSRSNRSWLVAYQCKTLSVPLHDGAR